MCGDLVEDLHLLYSSFHVSWYLSWSRYLLGLGIYLGVDVQCRVVVFILSKYHIGLCILSTWFHTSHHCGGFGLELKYLILTQLVELCCDPDSRRSLGDS